MLSPKKLAAEFIGTAILVVIAVGVATESFGFALLAADSRSTGSRSAAASPPALSPLPWLSASP